MTKHLYPRVWKNPADSSVTITQNDEKSCLLQSGGVGFAVNIHMQPGRPVSDYFSQPDIIGKYIEVFDHHVKDIDHAIVAEAREWFGETTGTATAVAVPISRNVARLAIALNESRRKDGQINSLSDTIYNIKQCADRFCVETRLITIESYVSEMTARIRNLTTRVSQLETNVRTENEVCQKLLVENRELREMNGNQFGTIQELRKQVSDSDSAKRIRDYFGGISLSDCYDRIVSINTTKSECRAEVNDIYDSLSSNAHLFYADVELSKELSAVEKIAVLKATILRFKDRFEMAEKELAKIDAIIGKNQFGHSRVDCIGALVRLFNNNLAPKEPQRNAHFISVQDLQRRIEEIESVLRSAGRTP